MFIWRNLESRDLVVVARWFLNDRRRKSGSGAQALGNEPPAAKPRMVPAEPSAQRPRLYVATRRKGDVR